jgi:integrase
VAWIRQLPSGKWSATVRLPNGERRPYTHRLKGVVKEWSDNLEADIRRGDWIDPKAAKITVGECWTRWSGTRRLELASRRRDASHWRCHVQPRWATTPVGAILPPDVTAWVAELESAHTDGCRDRRCRGCRHGAATVEGAVGVLRAALDLAVAARLIRTNPARGVSVAPRPAHLDRVLAPDEDEMLLAAADRIFPGRTDARLMIELMLYGGLRWEEAAALDREHVDQRRHLLHVGPVMERDGTIRPYPKSPAGERDVAVDDDLWPRVRARVLEVGRGGLLVVGPRGGGLDYSRWHDRVWSVILAGRPAYGGARGHAARPALAGAGLADPQPTPHGLRRTYGTRLAEQGVPPHEIKDVMGHQRLSSTERYLHAGPDRHRRIADATKAARGVQPARPTKAGRRAESG